MLRTDDAGRRTPDAGQWTMDAGRWTLDSGPSAPYYKLTGELKIAKAYVDITLITEDIIIVTENLRCLDLVNIYMK